MKNQRGFLPIIVILLVLLGIGGVYFLNTNKFNKTVYIPNTTSVPTKVPYPGTEDWKVFKDEGFLSSDPIYNAYVIRYPENCIKVEYKILECKLTNSTATIVLMARGRGGDDSEIRIISDNVDKKYSGGEGKLNVIETINNKKIRGTFRFTKLFGNEYDDAWMMEFYGISSNDYLEFANLLDKILNTVEFIK